MSLESWKTEIQVWDSVTDLPKAKRGGAVALSLTGPKRQIALGIPLNELSAEDGLQKLLTTFENAFGQEASYELFNDYEKFEKIRRTSESINDYITDFEQVLGKLKKHKIDLPEPVLACKLLYCAGLDERDKKLALSATNELKFETMKGSLRRIFSSVFSVDGQKPDNAPVVKEEPVFATEESALWSSGRGRWSARGNFRGRTRPNRGYQQSNNRTRGTNPVGKDGRISTCAICGSRFHWAKDCPNKEENVLTSEETPQDSDNVFLTFVMVTEQLSIESQGKAVFDSACTSSVAGKDWVNNYVKHLPPELRQQIRQENASSKIVFGAGEPVKASVLVYLPAKIGEVNCFFKILVIPLLLSVNALRKAKLSINFDTLELSGPCGISIILETASSGHLLLKIDNFEPRIESLIASDLEPSHILKLHRQFGHASAVKLASLISKTGKFRMSIQSIENIVKKCDICSRFGRTSAKPVVSLPLSNEWNHTIAMDLHKCFEFGANCWYLHIFDVFTWLSVAVFVSNKEPETIIRELLLNWCLTFGFPRVIFTDNGGEFSNKHMHSFGQTYDIVIKTTAAESPFSNGIVERHNAVLTETLLKLKAESPKLKPQTMLRFATYAKNALLNHDGYSPHQLVFGKGVNIPSVMSNDPPALEAQTTSEFPAEHIAALSQARKAFIEAECSNRVRRALRANIRGDKGPFLFGDWVYYKRQNENEWRGPGKVVGIDEPIFFIRHGGIVVKVHRTHLKRCSEPMFASNSSEVDQKPGCQTSESNTICPESESDEEPIFQPGNPIVRPEKAIVEPGKRIEFVSQLPDFVGQQITAKVLSRGGKATGRNKHFWNIEYEKPDTISGEKDCVDVSKLSDLVVTNDPENVLATSAEELFSEAKACELSSWVENGVFKRVQDYGYFLLSTRWVLTEKNSRRKARLVVGGFEDPDNDKVIKDSPTCSKEAFRILLSIGVQMSWRSHSMDIRTAFLQGMPLKRDVYVKPPAEANEALNVAWKLEKCVYGLTDAARHWYERVNSELTQLGCAVSKFDPCLFVYKMSGRLAGLISTHVDDFWWCGNGQFETSVIKRLNEVFDVKSNDTCPLKYLGLNVIETENGLSINQSDYAEDLTELVSPDKGINLKPHDKRDLRGLLGKLQWLAVQSRPDLCFAVNSLLASSANWSRDDIARANKLVRKIRASRSTCAFHFVPLGPMDDWKLLVYADSSFNNLPLSGTQAGYLIFLVGSARQCILLNWKSHKLRRVVRSTLCAETIALMNALEDALLCKSILMEILGLKIPIFALSDSRSLVETVYSTKVPNDKRLMVEIASLRELIENAEVRELRWVSSSLQLADALTKSSTGASENLLKTIQNHVILS